MRRKDQNGFLKNLKVSNDPKKNLMIIGMGGALLAIVLSYLLRYILTALS